MFTFFSDALDVEAQAELAKGSSVRHLKRQEILYRTDDMPMGLHFVQCGLIGLVVTTLNGNEQLIRLAKTGQHIGHRSFFASEPHYATATALESTTIITITKQALLNAVKCSPNLALIILKNISKELKLAELGKVSLAEKSVCSRVAESLVYLRECFPEHRWTRREIAEFCSSTTPTVIRALAKLENRGIIRQTKRDIEIVDRAALLDYRTNSI